MSQKNYIISIYNPLIGQAEEIEVSEAVYNEYRRGGWRIENSDRSFRDHETPFTDLKGGLDGAYENFDEFRSEQDDPAQLVVRDLSLQALRQATTGLNDYESKLIQAFFMEGKSVRQVASDMGLPHMTVHYQKIQLLRDLKKVLEK